MNGIDLKNIIEQHQDCIVDDKKLKAILLDLYPNISKGEVRSLCVILDSGIVSEIKNKVKIDPLDKSHWLDVLKKDYCMSGEIVEESLDAWIKSLESNEKSNRCDTSVFRPVINKKPTENGRVFQAKTTPSLKRNNINGINANADKKEIAAKKHSENSLGYIYHNQLGYGKVEQLEPEWITARFIDYAYKAERYRLADIGSYLKFVSAEEYNKNTVGKKEWKPKNLSSGYHYLSYSGSTGDVYDDVSSIADNSDEWHQELKEANKTEVDDYDEDGAERVDDRGDDDWLYWK